MPQPQATLCYIVQKGRVLLIHKLRGVGAGKINGPGGKVDPGETPMAAAIRETEEETGITPLDLQLGGEIWFHFSQEHMVHCLVYRAETYVGIPRQTPEAIPEWFSVDDLPYDQMWEDDRHWLPLLLSKQKFRAEVQIDGDRAITTILNHFINDQCLSNMIYPK